MRVRATAVALIIIVFMILTPATGFVRFFLFETRVAGSAQAKSFISPAANRSVQEKTVNNELACKSLRLLPIGQTYLSHQENRYGTISWSLADRPAGAPPRLIRIWRDSPPGKEPVLFLCLQEQ